jgi:hypothetical protein
LGIGQAALRGHRGDIGVDGGRHLELLLIKNEPNEELISIRPNHLAEIEIASASEFFIGQLKSRI